MLHCYVFNICNSWLYLYQRTCRHFPICMDGRVCDCLLTLKFVGAHGDSIK